MQNQVRKQQQRGEKVSEEKNKTKSKQRKRKQKSQMNGRSCGEESLSNDVFVLQSSISAFCRMKYHYYTGT